MPGVDTRKLNTEKIIDLIFVRGWTKYDLASIAGVSPSRVCLAINGVPVGPHISKRIADALGLNIVDILLESDEPKRKCHSYDT